MPTRYLVVVSFEIAANSPDEARTKAIEYIDLPDDVKSGGSFSFSVEVAIL